MTAFEFAGTSSGPRHLHFDQDEWLYIVSGEFHFEVGDKRCELMSGWLSVRRAESHMDGYLQAEGQAHSSTSTNLLERWRSFFKEVGKFNDGVKIHEALTLEQLSKLFRDHGMDMVGPALAGKWEVDEGGRITQIE